MEGEVEDEYEKNKTNSLDENEDNFEEELNDLDDNSSRRGRIDESKREIFLFELFNDEQTKRYEKYKSSSIEHDKKNRSLQKLECPRIKKIVQNTLGDGVQIGNLVQIIINGVAKIYAGELVEEANHHKCEVTMVIPNGEKCDLKSIMNVFALPPISQGDTIKIICDGADEEEAIAGFTRLSQMFQF